MRDLAGTIIAARKTYEAALRVSGATIAAGDADLRDGMIREVDAQFQQLATSLGYLVTRDEPGEPAVQDRASTSA